MSRPASPSSYLRQLRLAHAFSAQAPYAFQRTLARTNYEYGRALLEGEGRFFYSTLFVPGELLAAFGLVPTPYEPIVGVTASAPGAEAFLQGRAEAGAFACRVCSYQALLEGMLDQGDIPLPLGFLAASFVCEDVLGMCVHLARKHRRPLFVLDVPYRDDEAAARYLAEQLQEMAAFIAELSGRRLEPDALAGAIRRSNEALVLKRRIDALRARHAGLLEGGLGFQLFTAYARFGLQSTVDLYRAVHDELSAKAAAAPGGRSGVRVLWVDILPWYSNRMIAHLERERGAAVVFEELNAFDWPLMDEQRPWESLARKLLADHRLGPAEKRVARIRDLVRTHAAQAVVCYSHAQCRVTPTTVDHVGRALQEMGVPWVELHGDVIDRREHREDQNRLRVEALLEMLE